MFVSLVSVNISKAQSSEILESEGTDFWFTFMPNAHNTDRVYSTDSLHIYVTSKMPTKGTIYYSEFVSNNNVVPVIIHFEIKKPNEVYHIAIQYYYVALRGEYNSAIKFTDNDNEVVTKKSFHITTEAKSTVYALDYADLTAEAFLVLPSPALGKEYYIMSYPSSSQYNTPSQFAIVGIKDSTKITIEPTASTVKNGFTIQTITLNKGEVYLIQNNIIYGKKTDNDLTGTHINADKEIAVFAGHQRTEIPLEYAMSNASRDCLIEQMIPVSCWGKNAIITPFASVSSGTYKDIYRVIAAKDDTKIYVDGIFAATLNKGQYYQNYLLKAAVISSDNPIMVSSYMKTAGSSLGDIGDPSVLIIPPVEQYKNNYTVINAQFFSEQSGYFGDTMILAQYLNIIVPNEARDSVYIDGNLLSPSIFTPIGESDYYYVIYKSTDGTHNINCTMPISVIIYGYGRAVSYGYLGGMAMQDIEDINLVISSDTCYQKFQVTYTEPFHSGIQSFKIIDSTNALLVMQRQTKWKIIWDLIKKDNYKDAFIAIKITDIYGKDSIYSDTIRTKYIAIDNANNDVIDFGKTILGTTNSTHINIINKGTDTIKLSDKNFELVYNINFTISKSIFPIIIAANDTATIAIYYAPTKIDKKNNYNTDTLFIGNDCFSYVFSLVGAPTADTLKMNSMCDVHLIAVADSIDIGFTTPTIAPNPPSSNTITYKFPIFIDTDASINIFDADGNMCSAANFNGYLSKGVYEIMIYINDLSSGTYFINLETDESNYSNKLIINK
jgi:hypothetical protein